LMEEIVYSIMFRWFVGLNLDEKVWNATTFTKNRDRLLEGAVARGVPGARGGAGAGGGSGLRPALYGGRHAAGSVGEPEEFSAQGWKAESVAGRSR